VVIELDAIAMYNPRKHFQPAWLYLPIGIVVTVRGILAERFPRLRRVVVDSRQLFVRSSPFR
jgi:hypothetical protein